MTHPTEAGKSKEQEAARLYSWRFNYNEISGKDIEDTWLAGFQYAQSREQPAPPSGQDRWNDESVKRFAADLIWETYGKRDCISVTEEYFKTYPFKPTPESRWPTEDEMSLEATRHCNDNSFQEQYRVWHGAIQWVKEWLQASAGTREAELEKCLGEALKVLSDLKEDFRYVTWGKDETHFENTDNWGILCDAITKAKSLLNKTDL